MNDCVYLDNAAAMPVKSETLDAFKKYSLEYFANPEAVHSAGRKSRTALNDAAGKIIFALTGEDDYRLFWTSSATEAINTAISFTGFKNKSILTTGAEHPAMKSAIEGAEFRDIRKVRIKNNGLIDLNDLDKKLDKNVGVVAVHHVQNETGAVQNLVEVRKVIDGKSPDSVFIVDTVQSVTKLAIPWYEAKINMAFIAGHKIGAPSGGALLYNLQKQIRLPFSKYLNDTRSLFHNVGRPDPAICLTFADVLLKAETDNSMGRIVALNRYMRAKCAEMALQYNIRISCSVPEAFATPYITLMMLPDYQGEVLVRMLSEKNIMISAGSACEASKKKPGQALLSMGIPAENARTVIRVSFFFDSDKKDVDRFLEALKEILKEY